MEQPLPSALSDSSRGGPTSGKGAVAMLHRHPTDEAILVKHLIVRTPQAVAELMDRYAQTVRAVLIHVLGTTRDVEDLSQETFLTVVLKSHTLRDPYALRSFVISVAIRLARNELRKRALRKLIGLEDVSALAVVPPHDPDVHQGIQSVYRVLGRLDADTRVAFVLRYVEGYELVEVAEMCSCSLTTIKRKLAKAEKCFEAMCQSDPVLRQWMEQGRQGT